MEITDSYATFDICIVGTRTRQSYLGTFKVKCLPTPMDEIRWDAKGRELLGSHSPLTASSTAANLVFALSQLQYRILEFPPFWENKELGGSHIVDHNVIYHVLEMAVQAEEKYMENKEKEAKALEERLKNAMKNKVIEKEPEMEQIGGEEEDVQT